MKMFMEIYNWQFIKKKKKNGSIHFWSANRIPLRAGPAEKSAGKQVML